MPHKKEHTYDELLTNELLNKRFGSQFDLVRYAIKLAENKVRVGRDQTYPDTENVATTVLEEIAEGRDHLEDIREESAEDASLNGQLNNFDKSQNFRNKGKKETRKKAKAL